MTASGLIFRVRRAGDDKAGGSIELYPEQPARPAQQAETFALTDGEMDDPGIPPDDAAIRHAKLEFVTARITSIADWTRQ